MLAHCEPAWSPGRIRRTIAQSGASRRKLIAMAAAGKEVSKRKSQAVEQSRAERAELRKDAPNPVWFKPLMFGFMLLGLAWIIVFYISQATLTVAALGQWNILVGFGIAFIGFLMTTKWR